MKNPFVYVAIGVLKIYKVTLSPAFRALGIHCRHTPDCANYSIEAFSMHGVWRGFWLTLSRLSRCHPWGSSGLDPVPTCVHKQNIYTPWKLGDWSWKERTGESTCAHKNREDQC
ncbi:MAG: membrane protein insertion efficiency factor YidD [Robiginitomaculum sp.]|nr:membrane protein insertion efficiency factor YidD [Robiginitomaculum sp.]